MGLRGTTSARDLPDSAIISLGVVFDDRWVGEHAGAMLVAALRMMSDAPPGSKPNLDHWPQHDADRTIYLVARRTAHRPCRRCAFRALQPLCQPVQQARSR